MNLINHAIFEYFLCYFLLTRLCCRFRKNGIYGKEITPFVLQRVNQLTKGKSLEASILKCSSNMSSRFSFNFKTPKGVENTRRSRAFLNDFRGVLTLEEDFLTSVPTDFSNSSVFCEKIVKKVDLIYVISSSISNPPPRYWFPLFVLFMNS